MFWDHWPHPSVTVTTRPLRHRRRCNHVSLLIVQHKDFSELGDYFDMPVKTYSSGMMARLAFGVSIAIDFDVYLVDEITGVGDARFQARCKDVLTERFRHSDVIMISHDPGTLQQYCNCGAVLIDGQMYFFDSIEEAGQAHIAAMNLRSI